MQPPESSSAAFVVRNLKSGLLVPTGVRDSVPLRFSTSAEAWEWVNRVDAPVQDFDVEEASDV